VKEVDMGQLHEMKKRIDQAIAVHKLDATKTRGMIGMKAGFLIGMIDDNTPDDPVKLQKLRAAAQEVIQISF
jgi:hypothetical protein